MLRHGSCGFKEAEQELLFDSSLTAAATQCEWCDIALELKIEPALLCPAILNPKTSPHLLRQMLRKDEIEADSRRWLAAGVSEFTAQHL